MLHSGKGGAVLNTFDKDGCCTQEQREALELCGVVASRAKERKTAPDQRGLTSGTKSNPQSSPCTGFARVAQTATVERPAQRRHIGDLWEATRAGAQQFFRLFGVRTLFRQGISS